MAVSLVQFDRYPDRKRVKQTDSGAEAMTEKHSE